MNKSSQVRSATPEEQIACSEDLEYPRAEVNRQHPLVSAVPVSVMGVLAGADGVASLYRWAINVE